MLTNIFSAETHFSAAASAEVISGADTREHSSILSRINFICSRTIQSFFQDTWVQPQSVTKRGEILLYNFIIKNIPNKYDCEELIKVFIPADLFKAWTEEEWLALTDE